MKPARTDSGALRALVIHRYYWPDTPPYASILRAIVQRWCAVGWNVDVLTSQPSYKPELNLARRPRVEQVDEASVRRFAIRSDRAGRTARAVNVAYFPLRVMLGILFGPRHAVIMCSTAPPVVLGFLVSWAARLRGAHFIYHCMDIHPEIGRISGEFRRQGVFRVLRHLDMTTCRRAEKIVVLSDDMRAALLDRDPRLEPKIVVLNNFDLPSFEESSEVASPLEADPERLRVVFTGNLGRFQGLELLVEAALGEGVELDTLQLVFMGEGAAKRSLQALVGRAPEHRRGRVVFLPHGSSDQARALIRTADYGVVSLTAGVIKYAYPSKCATYLAEGTPILGLVESDSELARDLRARGFGVAIAPASAADVSDVLGELVRDRGLRAARSAAAVETWKSDFSSQVLLDRWQDLLEGLEVRGEARV